MLRHIELGRQAASVVCFEDALDARAISFDEPYAVEHRRQQWVARHRDVPFELAQRKRDGRPAMRREFHAILEHADERRRGHLVIAVDDSVDERFTHRVGREILVVDPAHVDEFRLVMQVLRKKLECLIKLHERRARHLEPILERRSVHAEEIGQLDNRIALVGQEPGQVCELAVLIDHAQRTHLGIPEFKALPLEIRPRPLERQILVQAASAVEGLVA